MTLKEMQQGLKTGDFSSVDLVSHFIKVSKEKNNEINAYIEIFDDAIDEAKKADKKIKSGESGPLTGIPIALKDNMLNKGKKVSAASKILENYTATYDGTVVKKIKDAGMVIIGRTNLDEFAMGASTENSAFGVVKNPHDLKRVPGGSSGGSAAAVAMLGVPVALGSDTGGSIRQPAGFCGCVGMKPTYGTVSRSGLIAMGSSLDQIGPIGNSVEDVETMFNVIKGHDKMDSTSIPDDKVSEVKTNDRMVIGVPRGFFEKGVEKDVLDQFNATLKSLEKLGHEIKEIDLPYAKYSLAVYYILMPAESSTNLSRFDGVKYGLHVEGKDLLEDYTRSRGQGFGPEVRRRILLGTYVLSAGYYDAYYGKANEVRNLITKDFEKAFKNVDVIATPTSPTPAFKIGEKADPLSMYLADIFTVPANITGMPAIALPDGFVERGDSKLPTSFQLIAPKFGEDRLFKMGYIVEGLK